MKISFKMSGSRRNLCLISALLLVISASGIAHGSRKAVSVVDNEESIEDRKDQEIEEAEGLQDEPKRFLWRHHPDEHSIYAHKSLMSYAAIKHHNATEMKEESTEDPEDYEALKTTDYVEKEWNLMFRNFDLMADTFSGSLMSQLGKETDLFEQVVSKLKPACRRDIYHIRDSVKKHKLWALRMADSNGKLPSGITYGRFSSPGDYEECLSVKVNDLVHKGLKKDGKSELVERHKFRGKYCLIDFRLPLPERPRNKLLSIHEPILDLSKTDLANAYPEIKNYSGYASVFYEIGYLHAFCLPSTCDVNDLVKSIGQAIEGIHIVVNNTVDCEMKFDEEEPLVLTRAQKISIFLLTILFVNVILASTAHYLLPKRLKTSKKSAAYQSQFNPATAKSSEPMTSERDTNTNLTLRQKLRQAAQSHQFYTECFSIQKNFERLTKPDPRGLTFIHYTRIVAMALTVITHTAGMGTLQAITKPADASNSEQIFRDFIPQMLANAFSSIQIFFFMAGFMLVISTYPAIKRDKGHASFLEYAIKRAIRLMPGLAATIAINFLWPLFVDGPMLTYFTRVIVEPCERNWWRTLGFMSNFDHVEKMCLRHSYFSASDYQLHIMAFPLLVLLYKQPTVSLILAAILTVAGFVAQVIMILTKTLIPFMMVDYIDKEAFFNVVHYIHHPVWNHMSAFFYGFIIGYLIVKQIRFNMAEATIKWTWYILMPAGLAAMFAPYFWNHYKRPIERWQMVVYVIVDRMVLLTTCAWLSYATMVLGKKPESSSKSNEKASSAAGNNLPEVVTLNEPNKKQVDGGIILVDNLPSSPIAVDPNGCDRLTTGQAATTTIPRQRSSPNFMSSILINTSDLSGKQGTLRPAISTHDLSSSQSTKQPDMNPRPQQSGGNNSSRPRNKANVSNLNTLCLVLSRLTFQLYLFNMVVLWVDVNHSKYQWYFSYYFIITKALAVYIFSSLMAMVFFVTLESPSLTLYIVWVKSRAQSRANRREKEAAKSSPLSGLRVARPEANIRALPEASQINDDGLHMRFGPNKPAFSFIDVSEETSRNKD